MHTIFDPNGFQFDIKCGETELKEYTLKLISNYDIGFTFNQLCSNLANVLDTKDLFKKELNTRYEGELLLNNKARMVIQRYIWELIWDKKLMIDLYVSKYRQNDHNIYLMKTDLFNE